MELHEELDRHCATKVELMAFREETAINFGKVNVAITRTQADLGAAIAKAHSELSAAITNTQVGIAKLEAEIASMELRMVKWSIATAITLAGVAFAMARFVH